MAQRSAVPNQCLALLLIVSLIHLCTLHNTKGSHRMFIAVQYKYCNAVLRKRVLKKAMHLYHVLLLCKNDKGLVSYINYRLILSGDVEMNPGPDKNCLKICNLNVRSLLSGVDTNRSLHDQYTKLDEIHASVIDHEEPSIIALTETWLSDNIRHSDLMIPGYSGYRKDRNRHGGGLIVYIKDDIKSIRRTDLENDSIESLTIQCKVGSKSVIVSNWYRPPNQNADSIENFIESFSTVASNLSMERHDLVIYCGDFNDSCTIWNEDHVRSELRNNFRDCLDQHSLSQMVNEGTRVTDNTSSILDLVITDSPLTCTETYCLDELENMDHKPVIAKFSLSYQNDHKSHIRSYWHYTNGDFWSLNNDLQNIPWENHFNCINDIDDSVDFLSRTLLDLAKSHIPFRTLHFRSKDKPWMTPRIRKFIRLRNRWCAKFKRTMNPKDKAIRNEYRKLVKIEIDNAKFRYTNSLFKSLSDPKLQAKKYWSIIKVLYHGKTERQIPTMLDNGVSYFSDKEKAELLCEHFTSQCTLPPEPPDFKLPPFAYKTDQRLDNIIMTDNETEEKLKKLKLNKSCGHDQISNRLLKNCASGLAKPLTSLFNKCMNKGYYPNMWKRSNSSPIYKKETKSNKNNYRPISLLPCLSKVFEKYIYVDMYEFCISNDLLTEKNSGFKKLDSTVNQLVHIVHSIYQSLDSHKNVCSVFLDISKAFDRVYHKGLIFKLKQNGISGNLLKLLESYLHNRFHRVVINGVSSEWRKIESGVPQGSILGPLLFLIYINDIIDDIRSNIYIFADDTSLMQFINPLNIQGTFDTINGDLQRLHDWSVQWRIDFNALKSSHIIFSKNINLPQYPVISMGGTEIKRVKEHKHLGIILDDKLDWNAHIDSIVTKASKRVEAMRRISRLVPRNTLVTLYKSIIRPILEYACVAFDNIDELQIKKLESIQIQSAIVCTGAYRLTSHDNLRQELGWQKLVERRQMYRYVLMYKIVSGTAPHYLQRVIPQMGPGRARYYLRNDDDVRTFSKIRLTCFSKSFFPRTIKQWNNELGNELKMCESTKTFRKLLSQPMLLNKMTIKLFSKGDKTTCISMARMRMGLSPLKHHLHKIHVKDNEKCDYCNSNDTENIIHYFLKCPAFANERSLLIEHVTEILQLNPVGVVKDKNLCEMFLFGFHKIVHRKIAELLYTEVMNYVTSTKRFSNPLNTN